MSNVKISLCIATFNRVPFLRVMLESIVAQATEDCEIVIADNASTDGTETVVEEFKKRFAHFRYFRQESNIGLDRNFDCAVKMASGKYCWLLPDDDVLKPEALATVIRELEIEYSLIVVNVDFMDFSLQKIIHRGISSSENRTYEAKELDRLYTEAVDLNGYIGAFVIKKEVWMARDRQRYFGSEFIHIGVVYQQELPGRVLLIAKPMICMRMGNIHDWWPRQFHIAMNAREVVLSLAVSESIKQRVREARLWRNISMLMWLRAIGGYSVLDFWRDIRPNVTSGWNVFAPLLVALFPISLMRGMLELYLRISRNRFIGRSPEWLLQVLSESRVQYRS